MAELGDLHVRIVADVVASKCAHGIERGHCLDFACLGHADIPVRGEKSWDSALQPRNGGTLSSQYLWNSLTFKSTLVGQWTYPVMGSAFGSFLTEVPTNSPRTEPDATERMMPVIGYRGWKVSREQSVATSIGPRVAARQGSQERYLLKALSFPETWHPTDATHATCKAGGGHDAPHFHCSCGLHVLTSLRDAPRWYSANGVPEDVVVGAVAGWGTVIQHGDEGWRAEFARPIAFLRTDVFQEQPLLERVARQYGVPVLERRGLELLAAEYGERFESTRSSSHKSDESPDRDVTLINAMPHEEAK